MTEWPWLMITLAFISTVQWPNSIAQHTHDYSSFWEGYHHRSKRIINSTNQANITTTTITTTIETSTSNDTDDQKTDKNEYRANFRNINVKNVLTSNQTKSLVKNVYSNNNSNIQPTGNGLKSPQNKIIFPNTINKFIPEKRIVEKCSMNGGFCVNVENYPREDVLQIFRTSKFMSSTFFNIDAIDTNNVETRISNINLQPFCESKEEVIFPEAGVNKNNEWRYIIQDNNNNNNFKQGIRVEKCSNVGTTCKFNENLPIGHVTTCVQKFIYKKMVAITDLKEVYYEDFKLPSCCVCMYSINPDLLTRKGTAESESRRLFHGQSEPSNTITKDVNNTKTIC